jgi:3',5'-cyclic AMP phosphodiesterase CpdA
MFVLAHLSDLHLAAQPRLVELVSKRGLGFINWHRKRKKIHRPQVLDVITADLKRQSVDHIAATGDFANLSLPGEYARARAWLEGLGSPADVTVVPGNHDVYVRGVEAAPAAYWGDYMRGDGANATSFPFVRRRRDVALIALSTALPTAPLLATGRLGDEQLRKLADALEQTRGLFRVVLIHHPPKSPPRRYLRRLTDAAALRRVLADYGAELLLHGHDHCRAVAWLDAPGGRKLPAVGTPSASASVPHGDENTGGYNIFHIDGEGGAWHCAMIARQLDDAGGVQEIERRVLF